MSPEQATGYEVGTPSDISTLGAVLAFAATGEGPFGTGCGNCGSNPRQAIGDHRGAYRHHTGPIDSNTQDSAAEPAATSVRIRLHEEFFLSGGPEASRGDRGACQGFVKVGVTACD